MLNRTAPHHPPGAGEGGRIEEIDGLRALAISGVLLWHYVAIPFPQIPRALSAVLSLGRSGVDLFFVLSGFLIGGILLDNRDSKNVLKTFYARRALRIWPSYFAVVGLWLLARHFSLPGTASELPAWQYLLLVQNFGMAHLRTYGTPWLGVTWSLAVEEQFYLLFPAAVLLLNRRWLKWLLCAALVLSPIFRVWALHIQNSDFGLYVLLPGRADSLALGALLAIAWRDETIKAAMQSNKTGLLLTCLVLSPGLVLFAWLGPSSPEWDEFGYSYFAALYTVILAAALAYRGSKNTAWLRSGPALFLSRISYTVYLFHSIAILNAIQILGPGPVAVLCALAATVLYATAFYFVVEGPAIRLGHKLTHYASRPRRSTQPTVPT